jgi:hypothetical protein
MGNVFYSLMTGIWPFEDMSKSKDAQKKIKKGERPAFEPSLLNSTDPFDQAMIKSIQMCWIHDPEERASARQVQDFIKTELDRLGVEKI